MRLRSDRLLVGLSSECGETCILPRLPLRPGEPSGSAELTLNPVGAAGSCGRSRCRQSCSVEGVSNSRYRCTAEKHSRGHRWVWAAQVQSETGDRLLPGSSILEQKAQATVPVALPSSSQGLTAPGLGCVSRARHKGTHHLPARQCCVLLHRTLGDLTHGNTM